MKRIFLFLGVAILMFSVVAACGDDDDDNGNGDTESDVTATLDDAASDGTEDEGMTTETEEESDATGTDDDAVETEPDEATGTEDEADGTEDEAAGTEPDDATGTEADAAETEPDDATGTEDEAAGTEEGGMDELAAEPVELGDVTIIVIDFAAIDTQGQIELEEGMQLLGIAATIENTGDEDLELEDLTDRMQIEDADGETYEVDSEATEALFAAIPTEDGTPPDEDEDVVIEAGDEINGIFAFQLSEDDDLTELILLLEDEDGEEVEVELE